MSSPRATTSTLSNRDERNSFWKNPSKPLQVAEPSLTSRTNNPALEREMQIFINTLFHSNVIFTVKAGDSIENLKSKIQDRFGYPPDQQRISYCGKGLQDGRSLADYNIQKEANLKLIIEIPRVPSDENSK